MRWQAVRVRVRITRFVTTMITCDRCKTENLDGSQYCDECGAPLRPNGRPSPHQQQRPASGSNGSHTPSPGAQPELAGGRVSAGLSFSSLRTPPKPHARLVIEKGRSTGKQFLLSDTEAQIGRWDADGGIFPDVDLDTDDPEAKVSRRHARITLSNGQYFLEDLGSTNGTFINRGKRLPLGQRQALCDGDEIIVGKTFLRFHIMK
jgi:hypothetical protein